MPSTTLHIDSRNRVTLPASTRVKSGEDLEMEILSDGRIILTPVVRIPKSQLWLWTPEVDALLEEAAQDNSPRKNMAEPGALDALRERLGLKSNNN